MYDRFIATVMQHLNEGNATKYTFSNSSPRKFGTEVELNPVSLRKNRLRPGAFFRRCHTFILSHDLGTYSSLCLMSTRNSLGMNCPFVSAPDIVAASVWTRPQSPRDGLTCRRRSRLNDLEHLNSPTQPARHPPQLPSSGTAPRPCG